MKSIKEYISENEIKRVSRFAINTVHLRDNNHIVVTAQTATVISTLSNDDVDALLENSSEMRLRPSLIERFSSLRDYARKARGIRRLAQDATTYEAYKKVREKAIVCDTVRGSATGWDQGAEDREDEEFNAQEAWYHLAIFNEMCLEVIGGDNLLNESLENSLELVFSRWYLSPSLG
jgi:hypothetical protein